VDQLIAPENVSANASISQLSVQPSCSVFPHAEEDLEACEIQPTSHPLSPLSVRVGLQKLSEPMQEPETFLGDDPKGEVIEITAPLAMTAPDSIEEVVIQPAGHLLAAPQPRAHGNPLPAAPESDACGTSVYL